MFGVREKSSLVGEKNIRLFKNLYLTLSLLLIIKWNTILIRNNLNDTFISQKDIIKNISLNVE